MAIKMAKKSKTSNGVKFTFADKNSTELVLDLKELDKDIITQLAIHGLSQKAGDSYSGLLTAAEAVNSVKSVWANLKAGKFNATNSGGGLLAEAIARIKDISVDEAQEKINAATEEQLETLQKNARVKAMITVIRGERASSLASSPVDDELEI